MDNDAIAVVIGLIILIGLIKGGIKTFTRNWIAALLLLIFLFPIWVIWAFFELFTGEVQAVNAAPAQGGQTVNVNVVTNVANDPARMASNNQPTLGVGGSPPPALSQTNFETSWQKSVVIDEASSEMKDCPHCAETIKAAAKMCCYCGRDLQQ